MGWGNDSPIGGSARRYRGVALYEHRRERSERRSPTARPEAEPSAFFHRRFSRRGSRSERSERGNPTQKKVGRNVLPEAEVSGDVTAVEEWAATLEAAGELTSEAADAIIATHGDRGVRAIEAVGERRVKEYRDFTVVVGHSEEYVVEDGVCECEDARYNLDPEDPTDLCWHVIAAMVARRIGAVDHHDMWYSEVREFL